MKILKYFIHLCRRRRLRLKTARWCSIYRFIAIIVFLFLFLSFCLLFCYVLLVPYLNYCCFTSSNVIVSLTSTPARFKYELPIAIHSLLTQTELPQEIRIYLSPSDTIVNHKNLTLDYLRMHLERLASSRTTIGKLFDKLVQIHLEKEDYGPATKYLPIIKEFHSLTTSISKLQRIIVCDDDHYYHPQMIATLMEYSMVYENSIVGLRGWRIREDLSWGVSDEEEIAYHIIDSIRLFDVYRVGIVTANHAYLIRPSFFDSRIYLDFNHAPADIRRVDDIWLNGYASKRNITRLVVPACCRSIGVTRTHELENYFVAHQMIRASANDHALKWFNQTWDKDIWYKFKGENRPKSPRWWTKIYREWIHSISRLKLICYFGFV